MEISIETIMKIVRKNLFVLLAMGIICAILTYVICAFFVSPTYEATAKVNIKSDRTSVSIGEDSTGMAYALRMVQTCAAVMKSKDFRKTVQSLASLDHSPVYYFTTSTETTIINITATAHDPQEAYDVVRIVAENADDLIRNTVSGMEVRMFETPDMPVKPSAPHSVRNAVLAFVAGVIVLFGILLLMELFGTKVKDEIELSKRYDLPVIAVIPDFNDGGRKKVGYYAYDARREK